MSFMMAAIWARASTSRPESISSRKTRSGFRRSICRISSLFFSPPENPSLRWRDAMSEFRPTFLYASSVSL